MGRPRSAAVYEAGPVRVTGRGPYRVRWMEKGDEREQGRASLADAQRLADSVAARLELAGNGSISGAAAFGALAEAWVERYEGEWSAAHTKNVVSLLTGHVNPAVGRVSCDRVTDTQLAQILEGMATEGYSADWVSAAARALRAVCRWGVSRGVWPPHMDPGQDLKIPEIDRLLDRTLIPTVAQVEALADAAAASTVDPVQALRRRWMIRAAAGTGVRWGEMVVLTPGDVDLDGRTVRIVRAWHPKEPEDRRVGPPKTRHSVRTVVIPAGDVELWAAVLEVAEAGEVIAKPQRGRVWNSSFWSNRVWPGLTEAVDGWPERAGYHYLRHHAIVGWLDRGVPIGNVSRLAGHHSAEFTMKRYVGPSVDYLDAARALL